MAESIAPLPAPPVFAEAAQRPIEDHLEARAEDAHFAQEQTAAFVRAITAS